MPHWGTRHDLQRSALADAQREDADRAARLGRLVDLPDPTARLADADRDLDATRTELAAARARIAQLTAEPAYRNRPADQLPVDQHGDESVGRRAPSRLDSRHPRSAATKQPAAPDSRLSHPRPEDLRYLQHCPGPGRGIGR